MVSLQVGGAFATTLRERVVQAREGLRQAQEQTADEIGLRAAQSRLRYLLRVATEHGVDVDG